MIVTLTLNPSLDRTLAVDRLVTGEVNRVRQVWVEAAGKGVNVSKALTQNGVGCIAVLPVGGTEGTELLRLLGDVRYEAVPIGGVVRSNVTITEADGTVTKLNEPGPELTDAEVASLLDRVAALADEAHWVVASGNLPPGVPANTYGTLVGKVNGCRVAVDTSGQALLDAVATGPALVKPNLDELVQLAGRPLANLGDVVDAAADVVAGGVGRVLVSLGPFGAILVDRHGALHGLARVDEVRNTVGAGDTLLAGFLADGAEDGPRALATGLAWARAAIRTPTTGMASVTDQDRNAVEILPGVDRDLALSGTLT